MAAEENVKVAVRLRPFLQNIKDEAEGKRKRIIRMDELSSSVSITNPNDTLEVHKFIFDTVLWSFDGYVEQADGYFTQENKAVVSDEVYCDQKQVYDEVGKDMVRTLWDGYNSTIFTFGESRSGKSWTLFGLGANKGIAAHALTDIFKGVRDKERTFQQSGSILEVRLTMAEVYNERVKDLLPASSSNSTKFKSSVKIRDHSKKGFYIDGLRSVILTNLEDGQQRLDEGFVNRALFLTSVNGTAGHSTTMICVTLVQRIRNHRGDEVTRISSLELIDLPACDVSSFSSNSNSNEDQDSLSETTSNVKNAGIRSLSNCVDMLLEASLGRLEDDMIPFQDHALTKLLRTSLTGSGRTFVILTLSPSDVSYDSSLFALQFADKVRMLSTKSVVNEEVTSKLLRELKAENDRLRKLISLGDFESNDLSNRKLNSSHSRSTGATRLERETFRRRVAEDMKAQIKENEREVKNLQQPLEERLKQFKMDKNESLKKVEIDKKSKCHIFNLNKDAQISGKIVNILPMGSVDFGQGSTSKGKEQATAHYITICGPGIRDHHGTFSFNSKDGKFSVKPSGPNCRLLINESPIQFETVLSNNDRLVLGSNQIWIYQNPKDTWLEKYAFAHKLHYDFVQGEMAMKSEHYKNLNYDGYLSGNGHTQVAELIGALEDAKSISEDLSQNFTCQPLLLQSIEHFLRESIDNGRSSSETTNSTRKLSKLSYSLPPTQDQYSTELMTLVKVENCVDGTFHYWSTQKFFERLEQLKDSYIQFLEDAEAPLKEVEALRESPEADVPIGYSILSLKPLAYLTNIEMKVVPILDYVTFQTIGTIRVALQICGNESDMKLNDAEVFLESPEELLGERVTAVLSLSNLERIGMQFKDVYSKYKLPDGESVITPKLDSVPPNIMGKSSKHERRFSLESVNENILNILLAEYLILRFWGKPRSHKLLNLTIGSLQITPGIRRNGAISGNPVEMERTLTELKLKEMCEKRYQRRLNALKAVLDQSTAFGEESVPISLMKTVFEAKSQNDVDQTLEQHKESLAEVPEEPEQKQLPPELKALKRCSEICSIC